MFIYADTKFWLINNYIAMSLCVYSIEKYLVTRFTDVVIIFMLLFSYDIYFVYYSDVMMSVAQGFDAPLKIMFPVPGLGAYGIIGIGDVVVPGLLVSMCLRYDLIRQLVVRSGRTVAAN